MDLAIEYVNVRLADPRLSGRAAARQVGFARGVPSKRAKRLYEIAKELDELEIEPEELERELDRLHIKLLQIRKLVQSLQEWLQIVSSE